MEIPYFHVDSFTTRLFGGNPAGVCFLYGQWPEDDLMLNIARENGLAETAFVLKDGDRLFIRWFTPDIEMDLCGHATLAAAFAVSNFLGGGSRVDFMSVSGELKTEITDRFVKMRFPSREPVPAAAPPELLESVSFKPIRVLKARDYVFVYEHEEEIRDMRIDTGMFNRINLSPGGVCVTAPGRDVDFVSRFFTPQATILEDPVTGSAHCSLVPYWAKILGKREFVAMQLSARGGTLHCALDDDTVSIAGNAVLYKKGTIFIR